MSTFTDIKVITLIMLSFLGVPSLWAQETLADEIILEIEEVSASQAPALHSYAAGQIGNKWILLGGRRDGLHGQFPATSFNLSERNDSIYVYDIMEDMRWSASVATLDSMLRDQLSAANFEYFQDGDQLFIIGGYGWSYNENKKITFPYLIQVHLLGLIDAIQNGDSIAPHLHQLYDERWAITGGNLSKLGDQYYLVMGHNFSRDYNSFDKFAFDQVYSNEIRRFSFSYNKQGRVIELTDYAALRDTILFHKRDYNLVPQIGVDGSLSLMAYSGVFQYLADLPWTSCVGITEDGTYLQEGFEQLLTQYHCPVLPLYDSTHNYMHTLFFGGMGFSYYEADSMVIDSLIPFIKTISKTLRHPDGSMSEHRMPIEMPGYEGSNAHFFYEPTIPVYSKDIIHLNVLPDGIKSLVGYIHGGIIAEEKNIFQIVGGGESYASDKVYKVYITRDADLPSSISVPATTSPVSQIVLSPIPSTGLINLSFDFNNGPYVEYQIWNALGQSVLPAVRLHQRSHYQIPLELSSAPMGLYYLSIRSGAYFKSLPFEIHR